MKNLLYATILIGLLFTSCKKDDDDNTPAATVPYTLSAPQCLLSKVTVNQDGDISTSVYQYDGQKRVISVTTPGSVNKVITTYKTGMMIDEETSENVNGDIVTTVTTHHLNNMGFVSRTINDDSSQTLYTYNNQGYLIREIQKSQYGDYSYGASYQYSQGNMVTSYSLSLDFATGEVKDSSLSATYYYYENLPGKIEEMNAWFERLGRGSKNELKSIEGGFATSAYNYTIGSNGMPSSLKLTYIFGEISLDMEWRCK